jgi:hypothetical protein
MPNDFHDISIFAHHGIVAAYYRVFPEPHFFIMGFQEAIQNLLQAYFLRQVQ